MPRKKPVTLLSLCLLNSAQVQKTVAFKRNVPWKRTSKYSLILLELTFIKARVDHIISHNTDQQMLKKVVIMAFGSFSLHSIFEQKFGSIPQQKSHFSTSVLLDVCALNVDDSQM